MPPDLSPQHASGPTRPRKRIFLSAVSQEFASHRLALLHTLTQANYEVRSQEHFVPGDGTLLEKLQQEISQCDGVVCLMGRVFGELAPPAQRTTTDPRSYTQWEHQIALGENPDNSTGRGLPIVRALASDAIPAATPRPPAGEPLPSPSPSPSAANAPARWALALDSDQATRLQHRFVQRWIDEGLDRIEFARDDIGTLSANVLAAVTRRVPPGASEPAPSPPRTKPPNPWPLRVVIAIATLAALLLLRIDATRARVQVLMPPFGGTAAEHAAVVAMRESLLFALREKGVSAASTDPRWVPWPWLEPEIRITGIANIDPPGSDGVRVELAARSAPLNRSNPSLQLAPGVQPETILDQLGIAIGDDTVELIPRQRAALAPAQAPTPASAPAPVTAVSAPAGVPDDIVTQLPDAMPVADDVARALKSAFSWPLGQEPTFTQVHLPNLKTRLTIAAFDRRRFTLDLIEQDTGANGLTIAAQVARHHVFVANAGFFDRDKVSGRLQPAGQMRVQGRDALRHPMDWARGALTVSQAGDLDIQYQPGGQRPNFGDLSDIRHLLQVGPVLIEPGKPDPRFGMKRNKNLLAPRIALCLRASHFAFVIVEWERRPRERGEFVGGMDLYDLAWVLAAKTSDGGLACQAAIALDGGWSTQYAYRPEGRPVASWPQDPVRVTTLLAVTKR